MDRIGSWLGEFAAWAWARHHNELSWLIRPWFLIPYCYFAYRRSVGGLLLTLLALATSMFWFPAPAVVDPRVAGFLAMEREWLGGGWGLVKILLTLLVPLSMTLLALAFWRRSLGLGLALINAIAFAKVWWSIHYGGASGWAVAPFALLGALVCDVGIWWLWRRHRRKTQASATR